MSEEITLNVDDTNALRIKLGLQPLHTSERENSKDERLPDLQMKPKVVDTKAEAEKEVGKRLVSDISSGGGVLDLFGDSGSTNDWLQSHAKKVKVTDGEDKSASDESSSDSEGDSQSDSDSQ